MNPRVHQVSSMPHSPLKSLLCIAALILLSGCSLGARGAEERVQCIKSRGSALQYGLLMNELAGNRFSETARVMIADLVRNSDDKSAIPALISFLDDPRPCWQIGIVNPLTGLLQSMHVASLGDISAGILCDLLRVRSKSYYSWGKEQWEKWWAVHDADELQEIRKDVARSPE